MNTSRLLTFILFGTLPGSAFAQGTPAPSANAPATAATTIPTSGLAVAVSAPDATELTKLLRQFLDGAGRNDVAMHERFWADDLIYTASAGRRIGKADIMGEVRAEPHPKPGEEATVYTAEDIRIQQYGDTAIVAFRLVATSPKDGTKEIKNYLNSGTFLKREGKWQVVNWQATVMPDKAATKP
jgi:ketosteroid isomerase-like protein